MAHNESSSPSAAQLPWRQMQLQVLTLCRAQALANNAVSAQQQQQKDSSQGYAAMNSNCIDAATHHTPQPNPLSISFAYRATRLPHENAIAHQGGAG